MAIENEKIFLSARAQKSDFLKKNVGLPIIRPMTKAYPHCAGVQRACGTVGQGRTVKPGTHRNPLPSQNVRRLLAVHWGHKRHHACLMWAVKNLKAQLF